MGVKTRIGIGSLVRGGLGSVELPDEVIMFCPQCKTEVADKGQCLVSFEKMPDTESKTGFVVKLVVDCRTCGCFGKEPAIEF